MNGPSRTIKSSGSTNKVKVFFSHTWQKKNQKRFVELIIDIVLKDKRIQPIVAKGNFPTGLSWKEIYGQIINEERAVVVFFFSPGFLFSDSCMFEFREACELLYPKGVPLLPVMLKSCKIPSPLGRDKSYCDMKAIYARFKKNKGEIDTNSRLYMSIREKTRELIDDILGRAKEFHNKVYVHRVSDPGDRLFDESRDLYETYPDDYRDDFSSVKAWIGEAGNFELAKYIRELYYIAYFRKAPLGILYASHYPSSRAHCGYCYINPLIVKKTNGYISHRKIAEELINSAFRDLKNSDSSKTRCLLELPIITGEDKTKMNHCFRGWENLSNAYSLEYFEGINYKSPEVRDFLQFARDAEPSDMHLMALNLYGGKKTVIKSRFISEILNFIYDVYHSEGYLDPFAIKKWIDHIDEIKNGVIDDLPENISVIKINPKKLKTVLRSYE